MTKEEQILSATVRDRLRQAENRGYPTHTGFLTPAEVNFAESVCISEKANFLLCGGYADAERRICVLLPSGGYGREDWAYDASQSAEAQFLCVLKLTAQKGSRLLSHRDYMGAVLGLGVERSVVGDILVRENGADIVILRDMADFFVTNLTGVGRESVSAGIAEISELDPGETRTEEYHDTVASLRLDSVAASAFRSARGKAQEAIRQGLVSVNGRQVLKPDLELSEGDRISVRGKGKAVLKEVGGRSRKDRIVITITRFL